MSVGIRDCRLSKKLPVDAIMLPRRRPFNAFLGLFGIKGDVCDPELVRPVGRNVLGAVGEDRTIVIAVGCGDETPATLGLQVVLAHQTADLLTVGDDPLMA